MDEGARRGLPLVKGVALASILALAGCNFAVKHPAATAGIAAGSLAFVTCELATEDHKKCPLVGGAAGVGLAALAALALWLGSEDEPEPAKDEPPPKVDWSKVPDTTPKEPTKAPEPPPPATPPPTTTPEPPPSPPTTPPPTTTPPATPPSPPVTPPTSP